METLQQIAEVLRNAAYSDNRLEDRRLPRIDWSIRVIHPKTDRGNLMFSCGIWTTDLPNGGKDKQWRSIAFCYEVGLKISDFKQWNDVGEIIPKEKITTVEQLRTAIISLFCIEQLYMPKG